MSANEQQTESRSSVAITMNAKGEPQVAVKAYTTDLSLLDAAAEKALAVYLSTAAKVGRAA
jgi:hypothetical protein